MSNSTGVGYQSATPETPQPNPIYVKWAPIARANLKEATSRADNRRAHIESQKKAEKAIIDSLKTSPSTEAPNE